LVELAGNFGAMLFIQSGPIGANVGLIRGATVISIVAMLAHCPFSGVNVYVAFPAVVVEIIAGFQVPGIAGKLFELVGNSGATLF
jgi:hypothetical protein